MWLLSDLISDWVIGKAEEGGATPPPSSFMVAGPVHRLTPSFSRFSDLQARVELHHQRPRDFSLQAAACGTSRFPQLREPVLSSSGHWPNCGSLKGMFQWTSAALLTAGNMLDSRSLQMPGSAWWRHASQTNALFLCPVATITFSPSTRLVTLDPFCKWNPIQFVHTWSTYFT